MSKYVKKFDSWDEAKAANDLWSPNLTGTSEEPSIKSTGVVTVTQGDSGYLITIGISKVTGVVVINRG